MLIQGVCVEERPVFGGLHLLYHLIALSIRRHRICNLVQSVLRIPFLYCVIIPVSDLILYPQVLAEERLWNIVGFFYLPHFLLEKTHPARFHVSPIGALG